MGHELYANRNPYVSNSYLFQSTEKKGLLPDYCSGMAYLMTPDLAKEFVKASREVRTEIYYKIDATYLTTSAFS